MLHMIRLVKNPQLGGDYAKQLDLDYERNILICRMKSSSIIAVQLVSRADQKSMIVLRIQTYAPEAQDLMTHIVWMSRMSCYCDGS